MAVNKPKGKLILPLLSGTNTSQSGQTKELCHPCSTYISYLEQRREKENLPGGSYVTSLGILSNIRCVKESCYQGVHIPESVDFYKSTTTEPLPTSPIPPTTPYSGSPQDGSGS